MKKLLLFLVLIVTINVSAQSTTWFSKPLELETVPASTSKSDSVLVRGTDKIVKYLPISEIKSITNLDYLATPTGGTIFSSSGNDASVPLATTVNAGLFSPSDKNKLNGLDVALANKVDKVAGKGLSTEDYTTVEKNKLAGVQNGATANSTDAQLRDRSTHTGTQAISTVISLQTALDAKINLSMVGANNGVTPLDAGGKVPFANLPASLIIYKGMWNPSTNTPTLSDASGTAGWVYKTNAAGTANLGSGNQTFFNGDFLIHNGTKWERSAGTDAVVSVNGQQGIVTLSKNDIGLGSVDNTADLSKPISTATQTALSLKANLAGGNTFTGHNSFHLGSVSVAEPTLSHNPTTRNYVDSNFQLKISNPITGTGTAGNVPVFTGAGTLGNSSISEFVNRVAVSAKPLLVTGGYGIGFQLEDGFKITREISHTAFFYNNVVKMQLYSNGLRLPYLASDRARVATVDSDGTFSAVSNFVLTSDTGVTNRLTKTTGVGTIGNSQISDDGLKVGIGTDAPTAKLDIKDTNGGTFFDGSNVNYNRWKSYGSGATIGKPLLFSAQVSGTTPDLYINTSGMIGIGTDSPTYNMQIHAVTPNNYLHMTNVATGRTATDGLLIGANSVGGVDFYQREDNYMRFFTNNLERFRIHPSGGISIGNVKNLGAGTFHLTTGSTSTFDPVAQNDFSIAMTSAANRPILTGKSSASTGLYINSVSPNDNISGSMIFEVRNLNGQDFTTLTNSAFAFNRYAVNLVNILRNGNINTIGTVTAKPATLPTELATLGQVNAVSRPYKVYTSLVNQRGTNVPTTVIQENTIGNISWTRLSSGAYSGTLSGAFPVLKTVCFITLGSVSGSGSVISASAQSANEIRIITTSGNGTPTDGLITNASIEIRVYN